MTELIPAIVHLLDKPMPFEDWAAIGWKLRTLQGEIRWAIGDWLAYGETHYGDDIYQVIDMWGEYSRQSLSNMKHTSLAFPKVRRRTEVAWSSHAEIRRLPHDEQEQYLDELETGMTRAELRASMNGTPRETHACPICGKEHTA